MEDDKGESEFPIHTKVYARVGLMGNPSDGFFGKTLSATISNYCAQVWLKPSKRLTLLPHPVHDPQEFNSLETLNQTCKREGYHGGMRLLLATCKKFYELMKTRRIDIENKNFFVKYDTNIPRQVGLSGSSAIITALFKALMEFYQVDNNLISKPEQANFILSVETEEMEINAGLQDRVVQVYGGLVYMDFNKPNFEKTNSGIYESLDISLLPSGKFFIVYNNKPKDSGKMHSNVKYRFQQGDEEVVSAMNLFGLYAKQARDLLTSITGVYHTDLPTWKQFGELMNSNFDLRRKIYGDTIIGKDNLEMIEIGRRNNVYCKFPGSGGAILGLCLQSDSEILKLKEVYAEKGFTLEVIQFCSS